MVLKREKLKDKKKSGLMLYEVIISVFIISVCSVFILQLFLYSKNLNKRADDIDNSIVILLNAMELSKNYPTLNKYLKDEFFDGSVIETVTPNQDYTVTKYYDDEWNTIYDNNNPERLSDCEYVLSINISKVNQNSRKAILTFISDYPSATTYGNSSGIKYDIKGKVYYNDDPNNILIDLGTSSYFSNNIG